MVKCVIGRGKVNDQVIPLRIQNIFRYCMLSEVIEKQKKTNLNDSIQYTTFSHFQC